MTLNLDITSATGMPPGEGHAPELLNPIVARSLQHLHTMKRGRNERTGIHAWHPYYAGYAEQFVGDVIDALAPTGAIIFDPWNGSGTTTLVAQQRGFDAIGTEINPVMAIHAGAKDLQFIAIKETLLRDGGRIAEEACNAGTTAAGLLSGSHLASLELVQPDILASLFAYREAIDAVCPTDSLPSFVAPRIRADRHPDVHACDTRAFFLSALFQVLRRVGSFGRASNPTWIRASQQPQLHLANTTVDEAFTEVVTQMLDTLERLPLKDGCAPGRIAVVTADARTTPFRDSCVDLVVTSPPYCTRIDYAIATKPELLLLNDDERSFDGVRRASMGAPVIVDKAIVAEPWWGSVCNSFLRAVPKHDSKAASSYYLPNFLQYFRDAGKSMCELQRVLKPGAFGAIVVQSSYFKELEIQLGEIYTEMAHGVGLEAHIAKREEVRQHMAHINTGSRKYVDNKVYYEDVVLVRKR